MGADMQGPMAPTAMATRSCRYGGGRGVERWRSRGAERERRGGCGLRGRSVGGAGTAEGRGYARRGLRACSAWVGRWRGGVVSRRAGRTSRQQRCGGRLVSGVGVGAGWGREGWRALFSGLTSFETTLSSSKTAATSPTSPVSRLCPVTSPVSSHQPGQCIYRALTDRAQSAVQSTASAEVRAPPAHSVDPALRPRRACTMQHPQRRQATQS